MISGKKVALGVSGGVDSSIAAYLLKESGFLPTLVYLKLYPVPGMEQTLEKIASLADFLNVDWEVMDMQPQFSGIIIRDFLDEYHAARTPNPCVLCNQKIKFSALEEFREKNGMDYIATGHYAKTGSIDGNIFLVPPLDVHKDQSYYLYRLSGDTLSRVLFPLADYTKSNVREIYHSVFGGEYPDSESQDICFLPDGDYRSFYRENGPLTPGTFFSSDGKKLGDHPGKELFTVGQRRGLGLGGGGTLYVLEIRENGDIILGNREDRKISEFFLWNIHLAYPELFPMEEDVETLVQIRYNAPFQEARVRRNDISLKIQLHNPIPDVTPGQACVLYDPKKKYVKGGGRIRL